MTLERETPSAITLGGLRQGGAADGGGGGVRTAAREDGGKAEIRADAADGAAGGPRAEESRSLAARLEDAERELERMRAERAVLVKNMSCIYKTAKAEIARKDCIIEDLRKKAFRPKGG